jgi:hypothetical protein
MIATELDIKNPINRDDGTRIWHHQSFTRFVDFKGREGLHVWLGTDDRDIRPIGLGQAVDQPQRYFKDVTEVLHPDTICGKIWLGISQPPITLSDYDLPTSIWPGWTHLMHWGVFDLEVLTNPSLRQKGTASLENLPTPSQAFEFVIADFNSYPNPLEATNALVEHFDIQIHSKPKTLVGQNLPWLHPHMANRGEQSLDNN